MSNKNTIQKFIAKKSISDTVNTVEKGWLGLNFTTGANYGTVFEDNRADFRFPQSIKTFEYMSQDPTIAAANNILDIMINKINWSFKVSENATAKEKAANDFLNWCMVNMDHTWKSFIEEIGSYRIYGFHVAEKVWKEINPIESKKYSGKFKWKKLPTRSQTTIQGWSFDDEVRELVSVKQNLENISNIFNIKTTDSDGLIDLPISKVLLFSYKKRRGNPEGHSPLKDCYQPWTYKKTIESYEAVGVAKDLGGVPVLGVDANWLAKAQEDSSSSEGQVLETLTTYMENLHAGEQTYMIMPIAYNDSGKELFKFDLIGVDGGGKQYNTRDIINGKQLEILMIYLADVLKLGADNHGSFALAENKNNLLTFGIENHLQFISDVIDNDLIPQTLAINGWGDIPKEKMPKLSHTDLDEVDTEKLSKLIQRLASTNMIPRGTVLINEILEKSGFKYRLQEGDNEPDRPYTTETPYPELFTDNESGASEGMESGLPNGTGDSNKNNSDLNLDNKA